MTLLEALRTASNEDELLSDLSMIIKERTGADRCDLLLDDGAGGLVLRASTNSPEFVSRVRIGSGIGIAGHVRKIGTSLFVQEGADSHPLFARYPGIDDVPTEGLAALPFGIGGVCMLRSSSPWRSYNADQVTGAVSDAAEALAAFRAIWDSASGADRLDALSEVSKTIAKSPYVEEILQLLVNLTARQFNYLVCTVRLLDETRQELVLRATQSMAPDYQRKRAIKLGESIAGRAIAEGRPIIVTDVQEEADYIGHDQAVQQGLRSMICVPLTIQDKPIGVMSCYSGDVREFEDDEIKALETLAKQAAVSIEHAKLQVRSTLMQEMHHRVKNNLQQIASLLRLQLRHSSYKSLEEAINDILARILAISSVHDLLSREDLDHVGIRSVAESLVAHQQHSLIKPDRHIGFKVRGDDVRLSMTQATQVALLLNELIQNAVEHGFEITEKGEVHVTVEYKNGEVALWVSNDGDQLPKGFDIAHQSTLGLQIVDNLSRGLGGKFTLENRLGWTVAEIKFQAIGLD